MKTLRGWGIAFVSLVPLLALEACGGGPVDSKSQRATGTARQATTATPLYTVDWHTPYPNSGVGYRDSEVDDAGNTYVLGRVIACGDCPIDYYAFVFDEGGAFVTQFEVLSGPGETRSMSKMRVNDTGFVGGGFAYFSGSDHVLVERFDTANAHMFETALPMPGGLGGIDLCDDGSTVALSVASGSTVVVSLDTAGQVQWMYTLAGMTGQKVRCTSAGHVYVAGTSGGTASVARLESDGSYTWTWTGTDAASSATFDIDNDGHVALLGGAHVYSLDSSGGLAWSISATQSLAGIYASDVVSVAGSTAAAGGGTEYYTGSYDGTGTSVCSIGDATMNGGAAGIALDDDDDAFLCGSAGAALYGQDGSTQWTYSGATPTGRTDVTNGVARCIGSSPTHGIGIVAFSVP